MSARRGVRASLPARPELRSLVRPTLVVAVSLGLLFLVAAVRVLHVSGGSDGSADEGGLWSVGLAAGFATLATGRRRLAAVLVAVGLTTVAAGVVVGLDAETACAWALGAVAEAWVLSRLVARAPDGAARLLDHADLLRLLVASAAAAGVGAVLAAGSAVAGITEDGIDDAGPLLLVVAMTHLVSHLLFVPFFLCVPDDSPTAGRSERLLQGALAVLVVPVLFLPEFAGTVFLVFPLLAWGATRCGFRSATAQGALLGVVATQLTLEGLGPFAADRPGLPSPYVGVALLQGYVLCALAVTLPLALAIALQHRREAEVLEERHRAEGLVRSTVGTAIIATDVEGAVRLANPGAVDLFGHDAAALARLSVADLFPAGELAEQARALGVRAELGPVMEAMSVLTGQRREWIVQRAGGEARAHLLGFARLADDRGATTGYVMTSEDVTERIQVQESLEVALRAEHELVARLKELDGVKDALVSTVSHELRTPITSILGYLEMLRDGDYGALSGDQAGAIDKVDDNGHRLLALIDDLLVLSRVQSGVLELHREPMDLRDVVRGVWEVLEPRLRERRLGISMELPAASAVLDGDREQLERVVVNLIGNAVKFTPDGGRVVVRLKREEDRLRLEVSDSGIGIPRDEQRQLFTRFFRSRLAAERAIPGTGLGLSIVQAIVEQHGGFVSADSEPGRGSTFRVDLPGTSPVRAGALAPPVMTEIATLAETAPVAAEPAPVVAEVAPVVAEVAPVVAESAPAPVESAPVVAESAPVVAEVAPVVAETSPVSAEQLLMNALSAEAHSHATPTRAEWAQGRCEAATALEAHANSAGNPAASGVTGAASGGNGAGSAGSSAGSAGEPPLPAYTQLAEPPEPDVVAEPVPVGEDAPPAGVETPAEDRSVEELLAATRSAPFPTPPTPSREDEAETRAPARAEETADEPEEPTAEPDDHPGEPAGEPVEEPVTSPARATASSRLAAARQAAGGHNSGESARAILDAFGPRSR